MLGALWTGATHQFSLPSPEKEDAKRAQTWAFWWPNIPQLTPEYSSHSPAFYWKNTRNSKLQYPLKAEPWGLSVELQGHVFVRWPDPRESFQGSRTEPLFWESRFGELRIANRRFEANSCESLEHCENSFCSASRFARIALIRVANRLAILVLDTYKIVWMKPPICIWWVRIRSKQIREV